MSNQNARRKDAVDACVARFVGKLYDPGIRDCIKLGGHSMHKMGRRVGLTKGLRYSSEAGGLKVMRRLGFASLIEAMDATGLPRITPASALPADIIAFATDGENAFGCALAVYHGNGKFIAFTNGIGAVIKPSDDPAAFLGAWRV